VIAAVSAISRGRRSSVQRSPASSNIECADCNSAQASRDQRPARRVGELLHGSAVDREALGLTGLEADGERRRRRVDLDP